MFKINNKDNRTTPEARSAKMLCLPGIWTAEKTN